MKKLFILESPRTLRSSHGLVLSGRLLSPGRVERPLKSSVSLSRDGRLIGRSD
jgi:hypothetical protein